MDVENNVSHLMLIQELVRRLEQGWKPADIDEFRELYLDLSDAQQRAIWHMQIDRHDRTSA
jgi:hypothetical protein